MNFQNLKISEPKVNRKIKRPPNTGSMISIPIDVRNNGN